MRHCRLNLNLIKLKQILNIKTPFAELLDAYNKSVSLDLKPEKGERKIADDYMILINEQASKTTP